MSLDINTYASWGLIGVAGEVRGALESRTFVRVHDADGHELEVWPTRVEASYAVGPKGVVEPTSLTIVGVPTGARDARTEPVASQYVGPHDVRRQLARMPKTFDEFVVRNSPSQRRNR